MGTMDSVTRETAVMQDMSCCSLGVLDSVTRCYMSLLSMSAHVWIRCYVITSLPRADS